MGTTSRADAAAGSRAMKRARDLAGEIYGFTDTLTAGQALQALACMHPRSLSPERSPSLWRAWTSPAVLVCVAGALACTTFTLALLARLALARLGHAMLSDVVSVGVPVVLGGFVVVQALRYRRAERQARASSTAHDLARDALTQTLARLAGDAHGASRAASVAWGASGWTVTVSGPASDAPVTTVKLALEADGSVRVGALLQRAAGSTWDAAARVPASVGGAQRVVSPSRLRWSRRWPAPEHGRAHALAVDIGNAVGGLDHATRASARQLDAAYLKTDLTPIGVHPDPHVRLSALGAIDLSTPRSTPAFAVRQAPFARWRARETRAHARKLRWARAGWRVGVLVLIGAACAVVAALAPVQGALTVAWLSCVALGCVGAALYAAAHRPDPPDVWRIPPDAHSARALEHSAGALCLGDATIDLTAPFHAELTRSSDHHGNEALGVTLTQAGGRLAFQVPVRASSLETLEELDSTAPLLSGCDFGDWVWPLIQQAAATHGRCLPFATRSTGKSTWDDALAQIEGGYVVAQVARRA